MRYLTVRATPEILAVLGVRKVTKLFSGKFSPGGTHNKKPPPTICEITPFLLQNFDTSLQGGAYVTARGKTKSVSQKHSSEVPFPQRVCP